MQVYNMNVYKHTTTKKLYALWNWDKGNCKSLRYLKNSDNKCDNWHNIILREWAVTF